MDTPSGIKDSIPAWIKFSVQAPGEIPFNGIYYDPPEEVLVLFIFAACMVNYLLRTVYCKIKLEMILKLYSNLLSNYPQYLLLENKVKGVFGFSFF